jgi:hypothetical protein
VLGLQVKGQLLEKEKLFEEAREVYTEGKLIVENNYGNTHRMY